MDLMTAFVIVAMRRSEVAMTSTDINVLGDDGKFGMVTGTHQVRIWNGLGSVDLEITHDNLVAGGDAYRHFLERTAAAARQKLRLGRNT